MITLLNKQRKIIVNKDRLFNSASVVMKELGYEDFDLSILLTNNKTIRTYNREYRHKDVPTDILSFPYYSLKPGQRIVAEEDGLSSASITKLQRDRRHVSSIALASDDSDNIVIATAEEKNIGDIMISVEYVQSILSLYNVSLEERLDTIIIHGICHLLGYSHYDPENDKIMIALEKKLAKKLKIAASDCKSEC